MPPSAPPRNEDVTPRATPEFSRPASLDDLPERPMEGEATAEERAALARRYDVPEVRRLAFRFGLRRWRGGVAVEGEVEADLVQTCVVTLDPVETTVRERVSRRFLPGKALVGYDEADLDAPEPLPETLDLGEIAAEEAALGIDPYPRKPEAVFEGRTEGPAGAAPLTDEAARPFAGLAALRKRGEK